MQRLALKAGVSATTTYIEQVRVELPGPLRTKIGKAHVNWPAFIKAVRDVDTVELELEAKEEKEWWRSYRRCAKRCKRHPRRAYAPSSPRETRSSTGGGGQGNLFSPPRAMQQQAPRAPYKPPAPRTPYQPAIQQPPLDEAQHHILIDAIARIVHHPDMEAGRRVVPHTRNVDVTVNTPFPLRPGHAPANSGECFRCGMMGHTNYQHRCEATMEQCVSAREQQWRRIAAQALKEAPAAIRTVGYSPWDVDDYGRPFGEDTARFEEVDDEGKA
ncbi:hypothetical protein B0H10DRAFT_2245813 [Mycena sp. CBHHK59/15]|nr:hypothetical protein B0H10DRAFT_2245813 [Mycena sp. CBHHK59/15]